MLFEKLKELVTEDVEETVTNRRWFEKVCGAPDDTQLPVRGSAYSAGYDFFAPEDITVPAHGFSELVFFNIKAHMDYNQYLGVVIRSSLATTKAKLQISQGEAIIDADYYGNPNNDGNIGLMFYNRGDEDYTIKKGDRCAQGIFKDYYTVKDDNTTAKRIGGYGSTGKQ